MLKKENRLKSRKAFKATYGNNCSVCDCSIVLSIGREKYDKTMPTRVGFVVSKKIHKRAVIRNKIKRMMREVVRLYIKNNMLPDKFQSMIFIAKDSILNLNYAQINEVISRLINKLANNFI